MWGLCGTIRGSYEEEGLGTTDLQCLNHHTNCFWIILLFTLFSLLNRLNGLFQPTVIILINSQKLTRVINGRILVVLLLGIFLCYTGVKIKQ